MFTHDQAIGDQNVKVVRLDPLIRLPKRRAGREPIVGIQEENVFAFRRLQTGVARDAGALVLLMNDVQPGIAFPPEIQYHGGIVRRTVVDANDLDFGNVLLHQDARQSFRQVPGRIAYRDDDGYFQHACNRLNERFTPHIGP